MGLLDDAIREHLELKRRRGGDPAEIARAEQDALGPVRREPVAQPQDEAHDDHPAPQQPAVEEHREPAPESEPAPEHDDVTHVAEPEAHEPEPTEPEPPHADEPRLPLDDPRHSEIVHQPTTEFRVEDHDDEELEAPEPAAAHADDDVLEETPDFLQETPEHDRLWFEQRPPRDFDFDG